MLILFGCVLLQRLDVESVRPVPVSVSDAGKRHQDAVQDSPASTDAEQQNLIGR